MTLVTAHYAEEDALAHALRRSLEESLHTPLPLGSWGGESALPAVFRNAYAFYTSSLLGNPCLFMLEKQRLGEPPAATALFRQIQLIRAQTDATVVFVSNDVPVHRRPRFIEQAIPFVIPGVQIYLPDLGFELREHLRRRRSVPIRTESTRHSLSPSAQAMLIFTLLDKSQEPIPAYETGAVLGYSRMTSSRAIGELETAGMAKSVKHGRSLRLVLETEKRLLWQRALPRLRTPVRSTAIIRGDTSFAEGLRLASESALARLTMLGEPTVPVFAVGNKDLRRLAPDKNPTFARLEYSLNRRPGALESSCRLQSWIYRPDLVPGQDTVDPLSLWLSLRDDPDERVAISIEEIMERLSWW
jgi:hypothetical protein